MPFVYMVRCSDDTLYTGYTTEIERRLEEHNRGTAAKYTRGRTPVELVYCEEVPGVSEGLTREHEIKQLTREKKEQLIADYSSQNHR